VTLPRPEPTEIRYVTIRDLADTLGMDRCNIAAQLRKRGVPIVKVRPGSQLAYAVSVGDAREWMRSRAVASGEVVQGNALKDMIEEWRKQ
jgi:hypothetical protein